LGLAIVAAIAEAHGGKARILPSADAGAHVVVTLPLCPLGADDPEAPEAPEAPDVLTPAGRSSQEVLN
ncbi:MAG: hypothetical protein ACRDY7_13535, partial [Acidimicrobiia bacterium]